MGIMSFAFTSIPAYAVSSGIYGLFSDIFRVESQKMEAKKVELQSRQGALQENASILAQNQKSVSNLEAQRQAEKLAKDKQMEQYAFYAIGSAIVLIGLMFYFKN